MKICTLCTTKRRLPCRRFDAKTRPSITINQGLVCCEVDMFIPARSKVSANAHIITERCIGSILDTGKAISSASLSWVLIDKLHPEEGPAPG